MSRACTGFSFCHINYLAHPLGAAINILIFVKFISKSPKMEVFYILNKLLTITYISSVVIITLTGVALRLVQALVIPKGVR